MYVATERGTSDNPEATRFSQCAHDQRRRLEAEDSVRQHPMCPIDFRWEETYTPTILPRSRSPHNVLHSPSNYDTPPQCTRPSTSLCDVRGQRGRRPAPPDIRQQRWTDGRHKVTTQMARHQLISPKCSLTAIEYLLRAVLTNAIHFQASSSLLILA